MNRLIYIFILITCICKAQIKEGTWRGTLLLNAEKNIEVPFNFEVKKTEKSFRLEIKNAKERISITELSIQGDSLIFQMPVFDTEFRTKLIGDSLIKGIWVNHMKKENNVLFFDAVYGNDQRFITSSKTVDNYYNGKWETTFSPNTSDSSKAIGLFNYDSNKIEGTFLTETGDYRYLEGVESEGKLYLSCFDGAHAYLFIASHNNNNVISGDFYAGSTWHEIWNARRNPSFALQNPETITYLKNPSEKINFSFNNTKNQKVSLNDIKYKNKAVIIQIMGSWCPNCMDESAYLSSLYKKHHQEGLEIIALAYERTTDLERAKINLTRLINKFDIKYEVLLTGINGKEKASESLPFLNKLMALPTTIFLDKRHQVKSIYTGFSGPATGEAYADYIFKTEKLVMQLLNKN